MKKLKASPKFFNQIDQTTDISKKAQLLSLVRFVDGDTITEKYLSSLGQMALESTTCGIVHHARRTRAHCPTMVSSMIGQ